MKHDVHTASISDIPTYEAKLADIATRRELVSEKLTTAIKTISDLASERAQLATAFSTSGDHDSRALSEHAAKAGEAENSKSLAETALHLLDAEESEATAMLAQARHLEKLEEQKAAIIASRKAAMALDDAAEAFNSAYEKWHAAHTAALNGRPAQNGGWSPHWPSYGAGGVASIALHPDVVTAVTRIAGTIPPRGKILAFETLKFGAPK